MKPIGQKAITEDFPQAMAALLARAEA